MMPLLVAMDSSNQEVAAAVLSSTNSTEGKIKLVKASVDNMINRQELKAPILASLKTLSALCEERNSVCHHVWAVDLQTEAIVTVDFRKKVGPGRMIARFEKDLRDLCNRTTDAAKAICSASGSSWVNEDVVQQLRF